jgi:hypothetical protein
MALPFLEAMTGGNALASAASAAGKVAGATGAAAGSIPTRVAWFFIPNGVNMEHWTPKGTGASFDLPPTFAPLGKVKDYMTVCSGLALENAKPKGDGAGDHARSAAAFLTGAHPLKTSGANIKLGISVDQVAAEKIGHLTRLPSLELGLDKGDTAGNCDSGYSCAYVANISWRSETTPMPKEMNPASLFDRLFGEGDKAMRAKRLKYRKSILDFVSDDAKRLDRQLGKTDQRKLDEYMTSIREIERRIEWQQKSDRDVPRPDMARPEGVPQDMSDHMKLMCDLLWLAWRTDTTRVSTVMVARDGSNRSYPWLGVKEGHHSVSHHGRKAENIEAIRKIDMYHMQLFAHFIERLKNTPEGDGNMLDHSLIMLGSGIGDGDRHNHDDLPVVMLGKGGGVVRPGRHMQFPQNTPLCNLYLSMLDSVGVKEQRFGDSTGRLAGLSA